MEKKELFNDKPVYTLTQISKSLHSVIQKAYSRPYYIKAEIVKLNFYPHSGHCYPELAEKENNQIKTQMRAIIWAAQFKEINSRFERITGQKLKEGINILCLATVEYDVKYGLALHIQDIEPTYTVGDLIKKRMEVIERLKKEGVFNANKKIIPALLPQRIAVISVETSKGYGDFISTLERNPYHFSFKTTLFPSLLQGERAIASITGNLDLIAESRQNFDCVVIVRGGGGDVGLSCYDDYELAMRVATFPLPVIAGIGHASNVTITDMVAFQSKITPTEVAGFFIDCFRNFSEKLMLAQDFIIDKTLNILNAKKNRLETVEQNCHNIIEKLLLKEKNRLIYSEQFVNLFVKQFAINNIDKINKNENLVRLLFVQLMQKQREELMHIEKKIELMHPDNILKRGFSITYFNNKPLISQDAVKAHDVIVTKLFRGEVESIVKND
ncbi:MAG: exodeoxyribonuclease VII large subunit [Bacteroidales bacterium]|jgi:exodeoxyribonuclease VII large subunit|nr:exodeoxyribonuclease VII large subunit [Bacteroidales bacterium]